MQRALVGSIGLGPVVPARGRIADVASFLGPTQWGRGYASEALGALLAVAFDRFGLVALTADHFTDNPAPGRVLSRAGFRATGTGMGTSAARLEPGAVVTYRLTRDDHRDTP